MKFKTMYSETLNRRKIENAQHIKGGIVDSGVDGSHPDLKASLPD